MAEQGTVLSNVDGRGFLATARSWVDRPSNLIFLLAAVTALLVVTGAYPLGAQLVVLALLSGVSLSGSI